MCMEAFQPQSKKFPQLKIHMQHSAQRATQCWASAAVSQGNFLNKGLPNTQLPLPLTPSPFHMSHELWAHGALMRQTKQRDGIGGGAGQFGLFLSCSLPLGCLPRALFPH